MLMFKLAIKNILRYKSRSFLTALVIVVSALSSVFISAFIEGMISHMIDGYAKYQTGHIRITATEFLEKERFMPLYEYLPEITDMQKTLLQDERIASVVPMVRFGGFIGQDDESIPVSLIGFDLENNSYGLKDRIVEGKVSQTGIVVGRDLQQRIAVSMGDTPLVVATTIDSALNGTKTPIIASTLFNMSAFDKNTVFMDLQTVQKLLRMEDGATEVFVMIKDQKNLEAIASDLRSIYGDYTIETYKTQMGSLYTTMEIEKHILNFIAAIIMFLGSLVIINSLVASIYERINEIGMLKALGYSDLELTKMLFFEGLAFGLIAGGLGFVLGQVLIVYASRVGFDLSSMMSSVNMPIDAVIYPKMTALNTIITAFIAITIPALVALFPARTLSKITVVEALNMRK